MRLIVIPADSCSALAAHPGVFTVSLLLREVLLALTAGEGRNAEAIERLRAVMIDSLVEARDQSLHLPEPRDDRLRAVTDLLRADPGQATT